MGDESLKNGVDKTYSPKTTSREASPFKIVSDKGEIMTKIWYSDGYKAKIPNAKERLFNILNHYKAIKLEEALAQNGISLNHYENAVITCSSKGNIHVDFFENNKAKFEPVNECGIWELTHTIEFIRSDYIELHKLDKDKYKQELRHWNEVKIVLKGNV